MAVIDLGHIRQALADRLATLDGLWAYAYPTESVQAGPYGAALVQDAELEDGLLYHEVGGVEASTLQFDVIVLAPTTAQADAARLLDEYRSVGTERSILTLLESGGNLDGACDYVRVVSASTVRRYDQRGELETHLWEVTFRVEVYA